jgi:hypothetical protein
MPKGLWHEEYWCLLFPSGVKLLGLASPPPQAKPAEPPSHKKEETQRPDLTGYWIGGLTGWPPLGFEKTR